MKFARFTVAGYAVGMVVGLGMVMTYGAMEASSTPAFCGSCHVMEPYYDSWEVSSHSDIACVDCHIPPGMTAELRKKFEAMSMVARYFTATYGTNPWAEVADESCLQCHDRRLLSGTEVFGDVRFDHQPHLAELRRGKRLQCTSCHSQIVQGSHIAVTATTCILCHFKNQEAGTGTAECGLCHQDTDRIVEANGVDFDHGQVARFGMDCNSCHIPPAPDSGAVPRERCVTCHNEPARLAEYDDGDLLHRTHVTEHKVECTNCHLEIEHVTPQHRTGEPNSECASCHGGRHSPQRDLYAGLAGEGVPPMPDIMYRVGVRCEGCHIDHGDGETATSGELACMSCHGPGYRKLFRSWSESMTERAGAVRRELDATARSLSTADQTLIASPRKNLELVERERSPQRPLQPGSPRRRPSTDQRGEAESRDGVLSRSVARSALRNALPRVSCRNRVSDDSHVRPGVPPLSARGGRGARMRQLPPVARGMGASGRRAPAPHRRRLQLLPSPQARRALSELPRRDPKAQLRDRDRRFLASGPHRRDGTRVRPLPRRPAGLRRAGGPRSLQRVSLRAGLASWPPAALPSPAAHYVSLSKPGCERFQITTLLPFSLAW